jgi:hypothetical protein
LQGNIELVCETVHWLEHSRDGLQWRASVNSVLSFRVRKKVEDIPDWMSNYSLLKDYAPLISEQFSS